MGQRCEVDKAAACRAKPCFNGGICQVHGVHIPVWEPDPVSCSLPADPIHPLVKLIQLAVVLPNSLERSKFHGAGVHLLLPSPVGRTLLQSSYSSLSPSCTRCRTTTTRSGTISCVTDRNDGGFRECSKAAIAAQSLCAKRPADRGAAQRTGHASVSTFATTGAAGSSFSFDRRASRSGGGNAWGTIRIDWQGKGKNNSTSTTNATAG
eukprot:SAG31_NODE_1984_length_6740_cov_4.949255_14_plen_208_part_00